MEFMLKAQNEDKDKQMVQKHWKYRIKECKNLVELSVDFVRMKLFKEAPELQSIDGHNLRAPPLPFISETIPMVKEGDYVTLKLSRNCFDRFSHHNGIR